MWVHAVWRARGTLALQRSSSPSRGVVAAVVGVAHSSHWVVQWDALGGHPLTHPSSPHTSQPTSHTSSPGASHGRRRGKAIEALSLHLFSLGCCITEAGTPEAERQ